MGIQIPVSPGELLDKLTILSVKAKHVTDEHKRVKIAREYALLEQVWEDSPYLRSAGIESLMADLAAVNERLWHLENEVRSTMVRADAYLMSGVALCISSENDYRARIKATINTLLDSDIVEVKQHGSD